MSKEELFERELALGRSANEDIEDIEDTKDTAMDSTMFAKCAPCLGSRIKEILVSSIDSPELHEKIKSIPDCIDYLDISLCSGKGNRRGKSPYQQFVSVCMKAKHLKGFDPTAMKDCARQWSERKKSG